MRREKGEAGPDAAIAAGECHDAVGDGHRVRGSGGEDQSKEDGEAGEPEAEEQGQQTEEQAKKREPPAAAEIGAARHG